MKRLCFLALLTISFAVGANQSLTVFAAANSKPQSPTAAPTPAPTPKPPLPVPGPLAPSDPFPCLPGNPCGNQ